MKEKYENQASKMYIQNVHSKQHVIMPFYRANNGYPDPNYNNTNCALVGVLKKGETLEKFRKNWIKRKSR